MSVGVVPIRRTYRWPTSAGAMWPSGSKDTFFKLVCPCAGKIFGGAYVSVNYLVTVHLSADTQGCPKTHGVITALRDLRVMSSDGWEDLEVEDFRQGTGGAGGPAPRACDRAAPPPTDASGVELATPLAYTPSRAADRAACSDAL